MLESDWRPAELFYISETVPCQHEDSRDFIASGRREASDSTRQRETLHGVLALDLSRGWNWKMEVTERLQYSC